jgi:adenine-specific DNA-methyltransferase
MTAPLQDNEKDALIARLQNENRSLIQEQSMLGLNYNHKKEDGIEARHLANNDIPVFTKVPELSTMKPDEDVDHLLIEGDNLPALVALLPTYRGKVNVIYIDPPYNTGNQDFVYNDRYVDSEDGFRHSKWLSFMKPRLQLAHEMLSDDGVIFVSIDDHEQAYLKVMMDGIFGEENFVTTFSWIASRHFIDEANVDKYIPTLGANLGKFKGTHEYVHAYRKTNAFSFGLLPSENKYITSRLTNAGNATRVLTLPEGTPCELESAVFTGFVGGSSERLKLIDDMVIKNHRLDNDTRIQGDFRSPNMFNRFFAHEEVRDHKGQRVTDIYITRGGVPYMRRENFGTIPSNTLSGFGDTSIASKELSNIVGASVFGYPKPVDLIKHLLTISTSDDALVLDFFAGSGTTGQAVAELNKEDGGRRKCILITNNFEQDGAENGIARDITSVRMKRVLTGKEWADGKKHEPLPGNLIYYRLDWQPMSTSLTNLPGMLPLSTFLGSLSINQHTHRLMTIPVSMPTLSKLVKDGHAALLTTKNNKHMVLALDTTTSDDFDALDTVKSELEGANLLKGLDVAMESGFDADTYMDSGVFDHEFTFPVPDIIQMQATVKMLKKDGVISINDNQEDHTHMNNDNNDDNEENR